MDVLFLYFIGSVILAVTSWVTAEKCFREARHWNRGHDVAYERGRIWRHRAVWFMGLALAAALAKIAGMLGLAHPAAHYTFLFVTFGLWACSARLAWCLHEDKPGLASVIGTILLIATCVVIVGPLVAILTNMFFGISLFLHIVVGLTGVYVGLRPAIRR